MSYISDNKAAWEEAFDNRRPGWGDDVYLALKSERLPFLDPQLARQMEALDLKGKSIAQFCCNNGRELLSAMQLGPRRGVGFDIAENLIAQARGTAEKAGIAAEFVACSVLDIPAAYDGAFDLIFFTIGAITWVRDLGALMAVVARCLAPGGTLLLHDFHPFMNMLPLQGEPAFDPEHPDRLVHPYFRTAPFVENEGMGYMTPAYDSKTFTSFAHTTADIFRAVLGAGLAVRAFEEYDYDVGLGEEYDGRGYPLSMLLAAQKP